MRGIAREAPWYRRRCYLARTGSSHGGRPSAAFAEPQAATDHCPNAHVRQQTGAALLLTAAPTSWSRQPTPVATTSSPILLPARPLLRLSRGRDENPGSSTAFTKAVSPTPGTRPTTASIPTSPPAAPKARARIRRHPRQRSLSQRPLRLDPAGSRLKPRHPGLRR